jgi:hypothetical protein
MARDLRNVGASVRARLLDRVWPTGDLDLVGFGDDEVTHIAAPFREICLIDVPADGVTLDADGVTATSIREGADYGGVRVRTSASIAGARVLIQIDVGFGDTITGADITYPSLLGGLARAIAIIPS